MGLIARGEMLPRVLRQEPTPELGLLIQATQRSLLHENNLSLCYNAGINFVGSLLVLRNQSKYLQMVKDLGKEPSDELLHPVKTIDNAILDDNGMATGMILFKNACGRLKSGLVITGPLSGLITGETGKVDSRKNIVTTVRVFNDEPIPLDPTRYHPYYPHFYVGQSYSDSMSEDSPKAVDIITKTLKDKFKADYLEYVKKVKADIGETEQLFVSHLLMSLCLDLGIPLTHELFQYTREPSISLQRVEAELQLA
jgi:hypothetical protein